MAVQPLYEDIISFYNNELLAKSLPALIKCRLLEKLNVNTQGGKVAYFTMMN